MLHWELWSNRRGERSTSPAVAALVVVCAAFTQSWGVSTSGGKRRTLGWRSEKWGRTKEKQEKVRVSCRHTRTHNRPQCGRFGAFGSGSVEAEKTNDCVRTRKKPNVSGFFGVSEAIFKEACKTWL